MHVPIQTALALLIVLPFATAIPIWQPAAPAPQPQRVPPRPHYRNNRLRGSDNDGPAIVANTFYNVPAVTAGAGQATGTLGSGIVVPTGATGVSQGTGLPLGTGFVRGTGMVGTGMSGRMPMATGTTSPRGTGVPILKRVFVSSSVGWNSTAAGLRPHATGTALSGSAPVLVTGAHATGTAVSAPLVSGSSGLPVHTAALHRRVANSTQPHVHPSGTGAHHHASPTAPAGTAPLPTGTAPVSSVSTIPGSEPTDTTPSLDARSSEPCSSGDIRCDSLSTFSRCESGGLRGLGETTAWINGGKVKAGHVCTNGRIMEISSRSADGDCSAAADGSLLCAEEGAMYGTCKDGQLSPLEVVKKGYWCVKGALVEVTVQGKKG